MNPRSQSRDIIVALTCYDPGMRGASPVKGEVITPVHGQNSSAELSGRGENHRIANALPRETGVPRSHDVVPESAKKCDHWLRKILIPEEQGHGLGLLLFLDRPPDLVAV